MSERWSPRSILLLSLLLSDDVFNIWGEGTMKKNRLGWRQGSRRRRECRRRCGTDIEPLKVYAFVAVYNNVLVIRLFWSRTRLATCYNDRSWWFIDFVDEMIHSISSTSRKLQFTSVNFWLCLSALRETKKKGGRNVIHLGHIRWFISIKLQKSGSRCDKRRFEWWQCQPRIIWSIDDGGTRHGTRSNTRFVTTPFCYMPPFSIVHSGRFSRPFDIVTRLPSYRYPNQDGHCWLNRFIILFFQNENLLVRFERLRSVAQLIGD